MRRGWLLAVALNSLLLSIAACLDDVPTSAQVAGDYTLSEVNSAPLPVVVEVSKESTTAATAGQLLLALDGDYSMTVHYESIPSENGDLVVKSSLNDSGRYSLSNNSLLFISTFDTTWSGTVRSNIVRVAVRSRGNVGPALDLTFRR